MRLWGVALAAVAVTACEEQQPVAVESTGQVACEANGGEWSSFKTKQGLLAEICCRPPASSSTIVASLGSEG